MSLTFNVTYAPTTAVFSDASPAVLTVNRAAQDMLAKAFTASPPCVVALPTSALPRQPEAPPAIEGKGLADPITRFAHLVGATDIRYLSRDRRTTRCTALLDGHPISVVARVIGSPSRYEIESAILHAAVEAEGSRSRPFVVLHLSRDSYRFVDGVSDIVGDMSIGYALISRAGGAIIRSPWTTQIYVQDTADVVARGRKDVTFTDLDSHALKTLLFADAPATAVPIWGGAGERRPIRTQTELAVRAGASQAAMSFLIKALRERELMAPRRKYTIQSVRRLLDLWLSHYEHRKCCPVYARPLYSAPGAKTNDDHAFAFLAAITKQTGGWAINAGGLAINGWSAARLHRALHVHRDSLPVEVAVTAPIAEFMKAARLRQCDKRDALFEIVHEPYAKSVMGGVCQLTDPTGLWTLPVVDLWQSALDVASCPDRGREQAVHVMEAIVGLLSQKGN